MYGVFGPLADDGGPCLRSLHIDMTLPNAGPFTLDVPGQMNVCSEGWIMLSTPHGNDLTVTHGVGFGGAGKTQ